MKACTRARYCSQVCEYLKSMAVLPVGPRHSARNLGRDSTSLNLIFLIATIIQQNEAPRGLSMNLNAIDLNLFVAFDVIYAERNLTRASEVLNITQPAVSNTLARLR